MLLLVLIIITHIRTSQCVRATSGHPVPNADILDDLLSKFLGDSYTSSALFDFILGESNQNQDAKISAGDNLDISILDVDSVRKIINFAKKKHEDGIQAAVNSRRNKGTEAYDWHAYIVNKTIDLMKHSIYMTQEKINYTRLYRKKYKDIPAYQIALLYSSAAAILTKMESLVAQQRRLQYTTHFIWYLIIYEKVLASNIDINSNIEKIFMIQEENDRGREEEKQVFPGKMNITTDILKQLLEDPAALEKFLKDNNIPGFK